jgi:hypothetical protein
MPSISVRAWTRRTRTRRARRPAMAHRMRVAARRAARREHATQPRSTHERARDRERAYFFTTQNASPVCSNTRKSQKVPSTPLTDVSPTLVTVVAVVRHRNLQRFHLCHDPRCLCWVRVAPIPLRLQV